MIWKSPPGMPNNVAERIATDAERAYLVEMLSRAPTTARRLRHAAENTLVLWAVILLGTFAVWWAAAWIARRAAGVDFGMRSPGAVWVFLVAIPLAGVSALASSIRWVRGWKDYRPLLRADIESGRVIEEKYAFNEAKRFQEPEHGGLMYFMRTAQDKVFTMFDTESQELGFRGRDPLESSFTPKRLLTIVRAPKTGFVIDTRFSGEPLDAGIPIEMDADPSQWPEPDAYCAIEWVDLESMLAKRTSDKNASADV